MTKMIKLVSSDGQEIEVEEELALQSKVIENMHDDTDGVIPLPLIHTKVLSQILEYCRKHTAANSSLLSPYSSAAAAKPVSNPALSAWDEEFVKLDPSSLYDFLMAANYLDVRGLVSLICETVASMIRGKQPEEIRQLLDIKNDSSPEQEKAIRSKNS